MARPASPLPSSPNPQPMWTVKKITVAIVGGTVLLIGVALVVLPGPAFLVLPAGLAILATEFLWARRLLEKLTSFLQQKREARKQKGGGTPPPVQTTCRCPPTTSR